MLTDLGPARCVSNAPGNWDGVKGSHSPDLLCRSRAFQYPWRFNHVMANVDRLWHIPCDLRKSRCCERRRHHMALTARSRLHTSCAACFRGLVLSRVPSLAYVKTQVR